MKYVLDGEQVESLAHWGWEHISGVSFGSLCLTFVFRPLAMDIIIVTRAITFNFSLVVIRIMKFDVIWVFAYFHSYFTFEAYFQLR